MIAFVGLDCQVATLCLTQTCCWQSRFSDPFSDDFLQNFPHCKSECENHILHFPRVTRSQIPRRQHRSQHNSIMQTNLSPPSSKYKIPVISSQFVTAECWLHKCRVIYFHQNSKLTHRTLAGQLFLQLQLILTLCPSYPEVPSPDHWSHLCRVYPLSTDQECEVWPQLIKLLMGKVCNYWTGRGGSILTDDDGDDVKQLLPTPVCI